MGVSKVLGHANFEAVLFGDGRREATNEGDSAKKKGGRKRGILRGGRRKRRGLPFCSV